MSRFMQSCYSGLTFSTVKYFYFVWFPFLYLIAEYICGVALKHSSLYLSFYILERQRKKVFVIIFLCWTLVSSFLVLLLTEKKKVKKKRYIFFFSHSAQLSTVKNVTG